VQARDNLYSQLWSDGFLGPRDAYKFSPGMGLPNAPVLDVPQTGTVARQYTEGWGIAPYRCHTVLHTVYAMHDTCNPSDTDQICCLM
jgi:hypothetical protein